MLIFSGDYDGVFNRAIFSDIDHLQISGDVNVNVNIGKVFIIMENWT